MTRPEISCAVKKACQLKECMKAVKQIVRYFQAQGTLNHELWLQKENLTQAAQLVAFSTADGTLRFCPKSGLLVL